MTENRSSAAINITNNTDFQSIEALGFQQFLDEDIPVTVFLAVLSIVGTVGNIHTLLIYASSEKLAKLAVRTFILWLAAIDLIACALCLPFEMIEIRFNYTFSSAGACKFFRFLAYTVSLASSGLLATIAIERYNINAKRLPKTSAKPTFVVNIISAIIVGISVVLSIPAFVFYGLETKETGIDGVTGSDCMILSKYKTLTTAGIYTGIVLILSTLLCVICCFTYGKILYIIFKQKRKERKDKKKSESYQMKSSSDISSTETHKVSTSQVDEEMSPITQAGEMSPNPDSQQRKIGVPLKANTINKYEKGIRLTVSLIVATAVSYFGYLIFLATIIFSFANPALYNRTIRPVSEIFMRFNFINNAVNPVVFCLIDNTFRVECLKLYHKTYCGKKCLKR